jgi:ABC-type glycerol-3-phosphate transport system permease component
MMAARGWRFAKDAAIVSLAFAILGILAFPFLWLVLTSVRPSAELFIDDFRLLSETMTLSAYETLLDSAFPRYILNSLLVCSTATFLAVTVSLLAAYSFSRRRFRWRTQLLILVVFSQLFPFVILITPIYVIFYRLGLVNTYQGLILAYIAITVPFSIYMLLGYLDSVPRELDEAAIIDGCSTVGVIRRIILPVAWPGVAATAIYAFAQAWNEFLFALTLMTQNELKTVPVGLAGFFGQYTTQWDLVMAASVVATVPTVIIFVFLQRQLVSGLTVGAVKN